MLPSCQFSCKRVHQGSCAVFCLKFGPHSSEKLAHFFPNGECPFILFTAICFNCSFLNTTQSHISASSLQARDKQAAASFSKTTLNEFKLNQKFQFIKFSCESNWLTASMIEYCQGDLLCADADALVNAVNTMGVMGKGIALQFKTTFPLNFNQYRDACRRKDVRTGVMFVVRDKHPFLGDRIIINFPTKEHWRNPSRAEWIESGLKDLIRVIKEYRITSVAIPPLGCGCGGLDWNQVRRMIETALSGLDGVRVMLYGPPPGQPASFR